MISRNRSSSSNVRSISHSNDNSGTIGGIVGKGSRPGREWEWKGRTARRHAAGWSGSQAPRASRSGRRSDCLPGRGVPPPRLQATARSPTAAEKADCPPSSNSLDALHHRRHPRPRRRDGSGCARSASCRTGRRASERRCRSGRLGSRCSPRLTRVPALLSTPHQTTPSFSATRW